MSEPTNNSQFDQLPVNGMRDTLAFHADAIKKAGMPPENFEPSFWETLGASARTANTIVSAVASKSLGETLSPTADSRVMAQQEITAKLGADGMGAFARHFIDVETEAQYAARVSDIKRELQDAKIMQASGATGHALSFGLGVIDLPSLIPGGAIARKLQAGASAANMSKAALVTGLLGGAANEALMSGSKALYKAEDAPLNIAASGVFSVGLGLALHKIVGNTTGNTIERRMNDEMADMAAGGEKAARRAKIADDVYAANVERTPVKSVPDTTAVDTTPPILDARISPETSRLVDQLLPTPLGGAPRQVGSGVQSRADKTAAIVDMAKARDGQLSTNDIAAYFEVSRQEAHLIREGLRKDGVVYSKPSPQPDANAPVGSNPASRSTYERVRELVGIHGEQLSLRKIKDNVEAPFEEIRKARARLVKEGLVRDVGDPKLIYAMVEQAELQGLHNPKYTPEDLASKLGIRRTADEDTINEIFRKLHDLDEEGMSVYRAYIQDVHAPNAEDALLLAKRRNDFEDNQRDIDAVRNKFSADQQDRFDELVRNRVREDDATIIVASRSLGAAAVNAMQDTQALTRTDRASARFFAFANGRGPDVAELLKIPSRVIKALPGIRDIVGQGLDHPRVELQDAGDVFTRQAVQMIDPSPLIMKTDVANVPAGRSVLDYISETRGLHAEATKTTNDIIRRVKAENGGKADVEAIASDAYATLIQGDRSPTGNKASEEIAKTFRDKVFEPLLKRFRESGNLDEVDSVNNAESYFPIVHMVENVTKDSAKFIDAHTVAFRDWLNSEVGNAAMREKDIKGARAVQRAAVEQTTATQKLEASAQHNENMRSIGETNAQKVAAHEDSAQLSRDVLKSEHADKIAKISEDKDAKIAEIRDAFDELRLGSTIERADGTPVLDAKGKPARLGSEVPAAQIERVRLAFERDKLRLEKAAQRQIDSANTLHTKRVVVEERALTREREKLKADHAAMQQKARDAHAEALAKEDARLEEFDKKLEALMPKLDKALLTRFRRRDAVAQDELITEHADALAKRYYKAVTDTRDGVVLPHMLNDGNDPIVKNMLKARRSQLWQQTAADNGWIDTNIFRVADQYADRAGRASAMGTVFKKIVGKGEDKRSIGDVTGSSVLAQIAANYDARVRSHMLTAAPDGEFVQQLTAQKARELGHMDALINMTLGKASGGSDALREVGQKVMAFNSLRLMGGTVLSSLSDPVNIIVASGFSNSMKHGFGPAFANFKTAVGSVPKGLEPDIFRINRIAGAVLDNALAGSLAERFDIATSTTTRQGADGFMAKLSKDFWRYNGLAQWTNFFKNVHANTTHGRFIEMSERGWSKLSQAERAWLTNLNVSDVNLAKFNEQWRMQDNRTSAGVPYGAYDRWADQETAFVYRAALERESRNAVITPTAGDKLALSATPVGQMIFQFRTFGLAQQSRLIARQAGLAELEGGSGRAGLYQGFFFLASAAVLTDFVKSVAGESTLGNGSKSDASAGVADRWLKKWHETPGEALYNTLDRTGVMWPVTETSNIMQKLGLPNMAGAASMFAGDEKDARQQTRFANRGILESAFGPTAGLVEDTAKLAAGVTALGKYALKGESSDSFTSSDFSRVRRLIPFQNAPVVQQILNHGHQHLGTVFDWPPPK